MTAEDKNSVMTISDSYSVVKAGLAIPNWSNGAKSNAALNMKTASAVFGDFSEDRIDDKSNIGFPALPCLTFIRVRCFVYSGLSFKLWIAYCMLKMFGAALRKGAPPRSLTISHE
jgi:hypothetical protein